MPMLRFEWLGSLKSIDPDALTLVGQGQTLFHSRAWWALADTCPLGDYVGGDARLEWLVASSGAEAVAVCPVLRVSGPTTYTPYHLGRWYFSQWLDDACRLAPEHVGTFHRFARVLSGYRRVLDAMGVPLDRCLVAASPLSYRGGPGLAPMPAGLCGEVVAGLAHHLKRRARSERLPLSVFCVSADDARMPDQLRAHGLLPFFFLYDNVLDLDQTPSFEAYLSRFRRTTRRAFLRDIRRTAEAGITFKRHTRFAELGETFSALYERTYGRYGQGHCRHPATFWGHLAGCLGDQAEAIAAYHDGRCVGFCVLLCDPIRREVWTYRIGRAYEPALEASRMYFSLSFYEPIRRAIELGARRLWMGPAGWDAKRVRGARPVPLYNCLWFPRRWDLWALAPYVGNFSQISRRMMLASRSADARR